MAVHSNGNTKIMAISGVVAGAVALLSFIFSILAQMYAVQERITRLEVSMNEIETQFCAMDIVRNLMHANDMRNASMLWEKVYGSKIPTDNAYYPVICNRRASQKG